MYIHVIFSLPIAFKSGFTFRTWEVFTRFFVWMTSVNMIFQMKFLAEGSITIMTFEVFQLFVNFINMSFQMMLKCGHILGKLHDKPLNQISNFDIHQSIMIEEGRNIKNLISIGCVLRKVEFSVWRWIKWLFLRNWDTFW